MSSNRYDLLKTGIGIFLILWLAGCGSGEKQEATKNDKQSLNERVDKLLERMTLKEKIGQMTQICLSKVTQDRNKTLKLDTARFTEIMKKYHIGSFLSGTGSAREWLNFVEQAQKLAIKHSRLEIPLLIGIDHVHGTNYVDEGTVFPHNIGMSCTFDTSLIKRAAEITAKETAPLGLTWNFAPVMDLGVNPYWPRFYETFGEDPLLAAAMGEAFVKGYQHSKTEVPYSLSACAKHFIGYSNPETGWDRTPADISDQRMAELYKPPFQQAFDAGIHTVMVNSGEVNGRPVHTSKYLLHDVLREQMHFKGLVLTDIKDIRKVVEMHGGAASFKDAVYQAIKAGIDMSMECSSFDFVKTLQELVQEGRIKEKRINRSVRKILELKIKLGVMDRPLPTGSGIDQIGAEKHKKVAEKAAAASVVLLKNADNILPLGEDIKTIGVGGFAANSKAMLNGPWTYEWMGAKEAQHPETMPTLFEAMKNEFSGRNVKLLPQPELEKQVERREFKRSAASCDAIVLTLGEKPYSEFKGNIHNLRIGKSHQALFKLAESTGKPVVVVLIEGRPRVINAINQKAQAVMFAGYPGIRGGTALAKLLSGTYTPSGKLSFSYPSSAGHFTNYYRKKSQTYEPLYPFGHGLSYSQFKYSNFSMNDTTFTDPSKPVEAQITVTNTGNHDAQETVLWYIRDEADRITRPMKQLKKFEKALIPKGKSKTFSFRFVPEKTLSYPDGKGNKNIHKGAFRLMVKELQQRFHYK